MRRKRFIRNLSVSLAVRKFPISILGFTSTYPAQIPILQHTAMNRSRLAMCRFPCIAKIRFYVGLFLPVAAAPFGLQTASAQAVAAQQLEIGPSGSDQVPGSTIGAAIGSNNSVKAANSLGIGQNHVLDSTVSLPSSNLVGIGSDNRIEAGTESSGVFGASHILRAGEFTFLFGSQNSSLADPGSTDAKPVATLVTGMLNRLVNRVENGFVAGSNNELVAPSPSGGSAVPLQSAAALGEGLINGWNSATVVGKFNDTTPAAGSGLLFAVGIGTGATQADRTNAMEVYSSGKIIFNSPQGDIPMGDFGN